MSKYTEAIKEMEDRIKYYECCRDSEPRENLNIKEYFDDRIAKVKPLLEALEIADRLEYAYHNAFGIDLAKCTKYGNESAEQQRDSYSTVMMYEVANVFDDILGE